MGKDFYMLDHAPKAVYGYVERRGHTSGHGTTTEMVKCPFCELKTMAYTWSLSGGGKRCGGCRRRTILNTMTAVSHFKTEAEAQTFLKENT